MAIDELLNFGLNADQRAVRQMVRDFCEREILPVIDHYEREGRYPIDIIRDKMGPLGLVGPLIPERYGGAGMDYVSYGVVCEELSRADGVCASVVSVANSLVAAGIINFGTEEQKARFLPPLAAGREIASACLTEPGGGSDLAALKTRARRDGDHYVIDGAKVFISHAEYAGIYLVLATVDPALGHRGITAFLVERGTPGLHARRLPLRVTRRGNVCEVRFEGLRVPAANRLGEEGQGFRIIGHNLDVGRYSVGIRLVGAAQACLELAVKYARERHAFGQEIGRFQLVQEKIADMVTQINAARLLCYRVGHLKDQGVRRVSREASMAKLFAAQVLEKAANDAMQIHGGYCLSEEYPIGRYYDEIKLGSIGEGPTELQKVLVAEYILGYRTYA